MSTAEAPIAIDRAGRNKDLRQARGFSDHLVYPMEGNQFRLTVKMTIRRIPIQKAGTESPSWVKAETTVDRGESSWFANQIPKGSPMAIVKSKERMDSDKVTEKPEAMREVTGC